MTWQDIARDFAGGLVDEPDLKVTRRIALVQSVQAGPPPSLTVTIGATANIAGVRYLGPWQPQAGDYVIVLFAGPDGFAVGKIDAGGTGEWVKTAGSGVQAPPARMGQSPATAYGSAYASWDHTGRAWTAVSNYVMLADTLNTFINAPSGGTGHLRIANNEIVAWNGTSMTFYIHTYGPNALPLVECKAGGTLWGGGTENGIIIQAGSAVIAFSGANANIVYPQAFPHGMLCTVVSNGDGPGDTVLDTTNYSSGLSQAGIQAITGGAFVTGNLRINYVFAGY